MWQKSYRWCPNSPERHAWTCSEGWGVPRAAWERRTEHRTSSSILITEWGLIDRRVLSDRVLATASVGEGNWGSDASCVWGHVGVSGEPAWGSVAVYPLPWLLSVKCYPTRVPAVSCHRPSFLPSWPNERILFFSVNATDEFHLYHYAKLHGGGSFVKNDRTFSFVL